MRTLTLALSQREGRRRPPPTQSRKKGRRRPPPTQSRKREQESVWQQILSYYCLGQLCIDVLAISIAPRREACPEQNVLQMLEALLTQERVVRPGVLTQIAGQDARAQR